MADPDQRPDEREASDLEHEVMAQCVDAFQVGGDEAVAAVLAAHPALAARLRLRLDKLVRAGLLGPGRDLVGDAEAIPDQLGEFKLRRRLGSGGMGVVFLAEQATLGRTVAVKLMRPEQRFVPGARARFRREVEVVARLGDPGIVPIYSVGQDQGIDFFAMEYVRGASLGEVLAAVHGTSPDALTGRDVAVVASARAETELPAQLPEVFLGTWVQTVCRIVACMARASQHAHERGVVHRDIKPNNAMVTPAGRVLLLDFGLAAASGSSRITRTGAMLGTLHYMAPEQLQDGEPDVRTDVYALGVSLYELLALHSPFGADSGEALRHAILHGRVAPLRDHHAEIPRDVQTIVAVAMDRDPARRYATAQALVDDLERFLQHRPITARPIGPWLRAVRWSQRHPAWATASALSLVALAATPFLVAWTRGNADREIAVAREQARSNLDQALAAVAGILESARSPDLVRTPGLDAERRRRIGDAMELLQRLRAENREDRHALEAFVSGTLLVAEFRVLCGEHDAALAALHEAGTVLDGLPSGQGREGFVDGARAHLALLRGAALSELGRLPEAAQVWREAVSRHRDEDLRRTTVDTRTAIAGCRGNLGKLARAAGDLEGASAEFTAALAIEQTLGDETLGRVRVLDSVRTMINLGEVWRAKGDATAARRVCDEVAQRLAKWRQRAGDDPEVRREQARADCALANLDRDARDFAASTTIRARAVAAMQVLVQQFPDRAQYRHELGMMAFDQAGDRMAMADAAGAEPMARLAVQCHEQLAAKAPDNPEHRSQLATDLQQLGAVCHALRQFDAATGSLVRGIGLQDQVLAERPADPHYRLVAAGLWQELGIQHWQGERWREGREAWRRAVDHYEAALANGSSLPRDPRRLPQVLVGLAHAEAMADDSDAAMRALQRLQAVRPLAADKLAEVGDHLHLTERADYRELLRVTRAKQATLQAK